LFDLSDGRLEAPYFGNHIDFQRSAFRRRGNARIPHDEPVSIASPGLDSGYHCPDGPRLRGFLASGSRHARLHHLRGAPAGLQARRQQRRRWIVLRLPTFEASYRPHFTTGNVAFDDWRKAELDRLEEERRRLNEMREEFDTYARELRRAKDQEEFDRFMRDRKNAKRDDNGPVAEYQAP
jgi:hypothetical protein